jgi:GH24 family phage-related lysozyme (muramidase)
MPDGFDYNSMGGAVTSSMAGEGFERGGYVGGGLVGNDDWSQIVAANKQALGVYGGAQPMGGGNPGAMGGLNIPTSVATPKLITAGAAPQQRPSGMSTAMQTGKDIAGAYKMGKEGLLGSAPTKDDPTGSAGLLGGQGKMDGQNIFSKGKDFLGDMFKAEGGLILPRHAYADGGGEDSQGDEAVPYDPSDVMGSKDPMEGVLKAGSQKHEMLKPANAPGSGGGSGLGLGKMAGSMIGSAFGPLGSMAGGFLGGLLPFAEGGVVPRQGYDEGGPAEAPSLDKDPTLGLISKFEGFRERPYWDVNALRTGFGSDTVTLPDGTVQRVGESTRVSVEDAKRDLARRAGEFQGHIKGAVGEESWGKLDPNSQAALTSVTYNYGRLPKSVVEAVQSGDKASIAAAVNALGTHNQGINARRRAEEASLIDPEGKYAASSTAPRPPGLVGAGMQPAAPSTGAGEKKGFGDIITSEGFVVPALGFLGSMLASDKRNLGQALGEGIMGGVGAYQAQRKEIPATAKVVEETRAMSQKTDLELVDRLLKFNQVRVARGQPPITSLDEFKKKLADGSIIETPSQAGQAGQAGQAQPPAAPQPGAAQPAAGAPSISTANDATERTLASPPVQQAMSQINWNNVAPSHNIPQIQAEIETTKRLAETATDPAALQQLQEKQAILRGEIQKILESKTLIDRNGSPFVPPEWQKAANQIESQKTKAVKDADAYAAMEQDLRANQSAMPGVQQKFENLGKILTNYQTGKLENFKTFVPAIAQAVGIQVDPDKIKTREDFEKFVKESRDLLFQQLKQVGGRILVTEVQRMQEAVVDPELQPGANRSLIASGKAATNYTQDFYDHYRGWKRDNPYATVDDFADMQREWQTKNKLQKYITEAEANTPVRGDFPPPNKRKDGYQYIVDTPGVRNLVVDGKRVAPNGYIGRWDSKANDFVIEKVL